MNTAKTKLRYYMILFMSFLWLSPLSAQYHVNEVVEESFTATKNYTNPYLDVELWVTLNGPNGVSYRLPAFWDGGQTYRVRMVATQPGNWTWSTGASTGDAGLDNKGGNFEAEDWTEQELLANPNRRGFLRYSENGRTFEYADGTPFFFTIDTRWTALTKIFKFDSNDGISGLSFKELVDGRKAQGFNSLGMVACYPSDSISGIWTPTDGQKAGDDGSEPFFFHNEPGIEAVDYTKINPAYWQQADKKMKYMADNGFAPFFETLRRNEAWPTEDAVEQEAFIDFTRYMWARYGCYNMLYAWIHSDGGRKQALTWNGLVAKAYNELGEMPYGQPRTVMGSPNNVNAWLRNTGPLAAIESFELYNVSNAFRDYNMFVNLRGLHNKNIPFMDSSFPTYPAANLEGFYPGYFNNLVEPEFDGPFTGVALDETALGRKQMSQYMMYGSVLNGALGGHAWGDMYYPGVSSQTQASGTRPPTETDGVPLAAGFNDWGVASMGHLKNYILDDGHDFSQLNPANLTNYTVNQNAKEFRNIALNSEKTQGLGFVAATFEPIDIINLLSSTSYLFEWYDIDNGIWMEAVEITTDANGRVTPPNKPDNNGWAFRIRTEAGMEEQASLRAQWNFDTNNRNDLSVADNSGNGLNGTLARACPKATSL